MSVVIYGGSTTVKSDVFWILRFEVFFSPTQSIEKFHVAWFYPALETNSTKPYKEKDLGQWQRSLSSFSDGSRGRNSCLTGLTAISCTISPIITNTQANAITATINTTPTRERIQSLIVISSKVTLLLEDGPLPFVMSILKRRLGRQSAENKKRHQVYN